MPGPVALPEPLLARFRTVSFERLERVDSAWIALTSGTAGPNVEDEVYQDLHTLKGDARVIGFSDVAVLCQRLEDVLGAARSRKYRVHEEVDIVVTMAIQFIGMLLRNKADSRRTGIDLDGFLVQIQHVLTDWLHRSEVPASTPTGRHLRLPDIAARAGAGPRHRLSTVATTVYLEHLRATGASQDRLREAWNVLSREIAELEWVPLSPTLGRHAAAGSELASELGKKLRVQLEAGDVRVATEVLDTLNTAVLHTVRNAVDHGIELPRERSAHGKDAEGTVRITARTLDGMVEVVVADDGAGIGLLRLRARAEEAGLVAKGAELSEGDVLDLVFCPGLSTREAVSEVSGRGVGMDAVRSAVAHLGGTVTLASAPGTGTTVTVRLPQSRDVLDVHAFRAHASNVLFAVEATWAVEQSAQAGVEAVDLVELFELRPQEDPPPADARTVCLRRAGVQLVLQATDVRGGICAQRICRMSAEDAVEIVRLGDEDAILLRPEAFQDPGSRQG